MDEHATGAIICGYQGIGKSTLAKAGSGYIDLESGNFFVGGIRHDDWYIPYCQIAINLAEQGYRVLMSSHEVVREYLASLPKSVDLYVCFPSYNLHRPWIDKLEARYHSSGLKKDYRAWKGAEAQFHENIREQYNTKGFVQIVIHDVNYLLPDLIDSAIANRSKDGRREEDG